MLDKWGTNDAIVFINHRQANIHEIRSVSTGRMVYYGFTIIHYTRVEDELIKQQGAVITTAQAKKWLLTGKLWLVSWQHYFPNRKQTVPNKIISDDPAKHMFCRVRIIKPQSPPCRLSLATSCGDLPSVSSPAAYPSSRQYADRLHHR